MPKNSIHSPVFICGFPGGGTDLLKNILNTHPDIYINGEMPFLYKLPKYGYNSSSVFTDSESIAKLRRLLVKFDVWKTLENINAEISFEDDNGISIEELLHIWFTSSPKMIWGNKTPQNSEYINELLKIFPNAKFILITRDIRDIALSWQNKWGKDVYYCSNKWQRSMSIIMKKFKSMENSSYLILKYEDLLQDIEYITKTITDFLGLAWSPRLLQYHVYTNIKMDGKKNYGAEIHTKNFNKWKQELSEKKVKKIEDYSYSTMKLLGYDPQYSKSQQKFSTFRKVVSILLDFYALLFVGNKYRIYNGYKNSLEDLKHEIKKRLY